MSFFNKIFKKRQLSASSDDFKVVLKTEKELSDEQRNTIITIVKNGIMSGTEPSDIAINIMMSTEIYDIVVLNRIKNGVEVIF